VTSIVAPPALQLGDERMTAEREETKYLVPAARLDELRAELTRQLPSHRFTGEGANGLPGPHHYVTTIYFDTPSCRLYRTALRDFEHNVKIRAKEYYDLHPSLAEVATDPAQIVRYQKWLWFELKRREGTHTSKRRFRLRKHEVPLFFNEGRRAPESLVPPAPGSEPPPSGVEESLQEIVDYCQSLREPLEASCLVNYRRLSWQSHDGHLRVTIDLGLSFYAPPPDLWTRERALVRSTLGAARGSESSAILEVKRHDHLPAWLEAALSRLGVQPARFSKFEAACRYVVGHG
jgi:SPX domain protein involved in polyphosphate accumulation